MDVFLDFTSLRLDVGIGLSEAFINFSKIKSCKSFLLHLPKDLSSISLLPIHLLGVALSSTLLFHNGTPFLELLQDLAFGIAVSVHESTVHDLLHGESVLLVELEHLVQELLEVLRVVTLSQ